MRHFQKNILITSIGHFLVHSMTMILPAILVILEKEFSVSLINLGELATIQILFLGRAHTGGDVFVYFPQDKLLYTGDAAFNGPSYLGDGFVDEWPSTLMNMKKLDFDIFVPGHGPPVSDLSRIDLVADFYRDLWEKTAEMHAAGVSAQEASKTLDLTNHTKIPISEVGHSLISVERMYYRLSNPD